MKSKSFLSFLLSITITTHLSDTHLSKIMTTIEYLKIDEKNDSCLAIKQMYLDVTSNAIYGVNPSTLYKIDLETKKFSTLYTDVSHPDREQGNYFLPEGIAYDPTQQVLYTFDQMDKKLKKFDLATNQLIPLHDFDNSLLGNYFNVIIDSPSGEIYACDKEKIDQVNLDFKKGMTPNHFSLASISESDRRLLRTSAWNPKDKILYLAGEGLLLTMENGVVNNFKTKYDLHQFGAILHLSLDEYNDRLYFSSFKMDNSDIINIFGAIDTSSGEIRILSDGKFITPGDTISPSFSSLDLSLNYAVVDRKSGIIYLSCGIDIIKITLGGSLF